MNFKKQQAANKLRGAYYTPLPVAVFLSKWVISTEPLTILEPSCGDGVFVQSFRGLHRHTIQLTGIELCEEDALKARNRARENGFLRVEILQANFLPWAVKMLESGKQFDAVVGNPPYIRYQCLKQDDQKLAERIFERYHLAFTRHANGWVPFVIASLGMLKPGRRMAMVVPSELLHVLHAAPVRQFLSNECRRILIIDPIELLFEKALQGTVLLMVEKKSNRAEASEGVSVTPVASNDFLYKDPESFFKNTTYMSGEILDQKWTKLLLSPIEAAVLEKVRRRSSIRRFGDIASVDSGILTGADKFFVVDRATVQRYGLTSFARPVLGRSEYCPGVIYDGALHRENEAKGLPSSLICFDKTPVGQLPQRTREYIALGEREKLHTRYKCRTRSPWYSVPSVYRTPIGMIKRSADYHRLIWNTARVYTTTVVYRIGILSGDVTPAQFVLSCVNSLTALSAELEGRRYGGGVLELVPSEIEKLLVPVVALPAFDVKGLDARIRGDIGANELLREQDEIVLKAAGITSRERAVIHDTWDRLRTRRQRHGMQCTGENAEVA